MTMKGGTNLAMMSQMNSQCAQKYRITLESLTLKRRNQHQCIWRIYSDIHILKIKSLRNWVRMILSMISFIIQHQLACSQMVHIRNANFQKLQSKTPLSLDHSLLIKKSLPFPFKCTR